MNSKFPDLMPARYILLTRIFIAFFGCIAIWWGIIMFPGFWQEASIERIAGLVIAGDQFKSEILARQLPIIDSTGRSAYCRPAGVRSAAIIRIRVAEQAMAGSDRSAIDGALANSQAAVRRSLACSPADPFLWLGLFWSMNTREAPIPYNFIYLRLSYLLGPNEGWIALRRNRIALAMFGSLPEDIKEKVIVEFLTLVKTGLTEIAADNFVGPGRQVRDVLLARMQDLDEASRKAFARSLHFRGYDDAIVPGLDRLERHPWQH
jgi:hypothetical protein